MKYKGQSICKKKPNSEINLQADNDNNNNNNDKNSNIICLHDNKNNELKLNF